MNKLNKEIPTNSHGITFLVLKWIFEKFIILFFLTILIRNIDVSTYIEKLKHLPLWPAITFLVLSIAILTAPFSIIIDHVREVKKMKELKELLIDLQKDVEENNV